MAEKLSGIIDPPIDDLLSKVDSKYQLVIFASKRARNGEAASRSASRSATNRFALAARRTRRLRTSCWRTK